MLEREKERDKRERERERERKREREAMCIKTSEGYGREEKAYGCKPRKTIKRSD